MSSYEEFCLEIDHRVGLGIRGLIKTYEKYWLDTEDGKDKRLQFRYLFDESGLCICKERYAKEGYLEYMQEILPLGMGEYRTRETRYTSDGEVDYLHEVDYNASNMPYEYRTYDDDELTNHTIHQSDLKGNIHYIRETSLDEGLINEEYLKYDEYGNQTGLSSFHINRPDDLESITEYTYDEWGNKLIQKNYDISLETKEFCYGIEHKYEFFDNHVEQLCYVELMGYWVLCNSWSMERENEDTTTMICSITMEQLLSPNLQKALLTKGAFDTISIHRLHRDGGREVSSFYHIEPISYMLIAPCHEESSFPLSEYRFRFSPS